MRSVGRKIVAEIQGMEAVENLLMHKTIQNMVIGLLEKNGPSNFVHATGIIPYKQNSLRLTYKVELHVQIKKGKFVLNNPNYPVLELSDKRYINVFSSYITSLLQDKSYFTFSPLSWIKTESLAVDTKMLTYKEYITMMMSTNEISAVEPYYSMLLLEHGSTLTIPRKYTDELLNYLKGCLKNKYDKTPISRVTSCPIPDHLFWATNLDKINVLSKIPVRMELLDRKDATKKPYLLITAFIFREDVGSIIFSITPVLASKLEENLYEINTVNTIITNDTSSSIRYKPIVSGIKSEVKRIPNRPKLLESIAGMDQTINTLHKYEARLVIGNLF